MSSGLGGPVPVINNLLGTFFSLPPPPKRAKQVLPNYTISFSFSFSFPLQTLQFQICVQSTCKLTKFQAYTRLISIGQIKHFGHSPHLLYTLLTNTTIPLPILPTGQGFVTPKSQLNQTSSLHPLSI